MILGEGIGLGDIIPAATGVDEWLFEREEELTARVRYHRGDLTFAPHEYCGLVTSLLACPDYSGMGRRGKRKFLCG